MIADPGIPTETWRWLAVSSAVAIMALIGAILWFTDDNDDDSGMA
jgi:anti-sigma-K factor RskA